MSKNQFKEPKQSDRALNLFSLNKQTKERFSRLEHDLKGLEEKLTAEIEIIKKVISR